MADAPRLLAVVAHPDDETFGFGSILAWAAAARAAELREAADRLGVSRVDLLDFADSGMVGNAVPGTLVAAPSRTWWPPCWPRWTPSAPPWC